MAKREISSTLKNLKFMQRAAQREEKPKEEEKPDPSVPFDGGASVGASPKRRCIVIMEGNPHPGALKGRMSFQSFNPSIDKLNEEAANIRQMQASPDLQNNKNFNSVNGISGISLDSLSVGSSGNVSDTELKRKQPDIDTETASPQKPQKNVGEHGDSPSSSHNNRKGSHKQPKRERLDWSVLRPPKPQPRMS